MSKYLAQRFSRITVDFTHMDGQACIRGLSITVSDVVKLAISGKSAAEIIAVYPELEADDVHQALAWSLEDVSRDAVSYEIVMPLESLRGWVGLLKYDIEDNETFSRDQIAEFVQHISINAAITRVRFLRVRCWVWLRYTLAQWSFQKLDVAEVVRNVTYEFNEYSSVLLETTLPDNLPFVKGIRLILEPALLFLLICERLPTLPHACLTITLNEDTIHFRIHRNLDSLANSSSGRGNDPKENLLHEGGFISIAALAIEKHKSKLEIDSSDTHINFEFDLPIWKENEK
ncbi:MAG: DUF433 domain-containing protein [Anaerolineae bacterium]